MISKLTYKKILLYGLLICHFIASPSDYAITYTFGGGRFGDNLLSYCISKFIAEKYKIPIIYKPFKPYSNQLLMHTIETQLTKKEKQKFNTEKTITHEYELENLPKKSTLFTHDLKFKMKNFNGFGDLYKYTKQNPTFKKKIQNAIQPIVAIESIEIPQNMFSLAVHVRKGGGYDKPLLSIQQYTQHEHLVTYCKKKIPITNPSSYNKNRYSYADVQWPTRFPPEQFYIDQIKKISDILGHQNIFVYIFTDDENPQKIRDSFKQAIKNENIIFACQNKKTNYKNYVLDDLFNMAQFDGLIRPASSYSKMAQLLGNHKIIICPRHSYWLENKLIIDEIKIINYLSEESPT